MNKRERLEATILGEPVDRVAVALWRHWPGDDQRAEDLAAVHVDFQKIYDWDFVKVSPSSSFCLKDWGIEDRWVGSIEGTRQYTHRVVQNPEDWLSLKILDPTKGGLGEQLHCLSLLNKEFQEDVPFVQTIFSPLAQAKNLAGKANLLLHMRQNAGQVHHALQTITDTTIRFIQEARKRGVAGVYYAVQLVDHLTMSESEYQVFGKPYDLQILATAKDLWMNVLHVHGAYPMFDLLSDYPVQVVNWHDRESPPDLMTGLKKIKGAASGGISRDALHDEDPAKALDQVYEAFQQTGGSRWIVGTGCVSLVTTPVGNLRKLRSLVDELVPE